jgi:SHS2 domain-containing protein
MSYETFEHTADLGLRVRADDLGALFSDAAIGLFSMIVVDLGAVRPTQSVTIALQGPPSELLLFDWLNELLYIYEVRRLLLCDFDVRVNADGLDATARGEPIDPARHVLDHEVKAITYHGLKLERQENGWLAEVIVDI